MPQISLLTAPVERNGARLVVKRPKRLRGPLVSAHALRRARSLATPERWYCLKDKWVTLKDGDHRCYGCNDWFTFGETARRQVIAGPGEFFTLLTCYECNDGKLDTNWGKIFGEEPAPEPGTETQEADDYIGPDERSGGDHFGDLDRAGDIPF